MSEVLARYGAVARARDIAALGVSRHALLSAVADGSVVKLRNGLFTIAPDDEVAVAAHHGGAVTCTSALRRYGVWTLDDEARLHVLVRRNAREYSHLGCSCVVHHSSKEHRFGAVSVREALRQCGKCVSSEVFFAAMESALNLRLLTRDDRAWLRKHVPRHLRWLVDFARTDAQSGLESLLRLRLYALGLRLQSQVAIAGVGRVDFVVGRVIIEVDGRLGHADPISRHKDLRRDAAATLLGYHVLRFDYALVIHDWPTVAAAILAATRA